MGQTGQIGVKSPQQMTIAVLILSLAVSVGAVCAQDILPFPTPPMGGEIETPTMSPVADDYFDQAPFEFEGHLTKLRFKNLLIQ